MINNSTIKILRHISEAMVCPLADVYDAYKYNMSKYNSVLSVQEILQSMEFFGLYSIDIIDMLANVGG